MTQANFRRYEIKYKLTVEQYKKLLDVFPKTIKLDDYGRHKISNIYFDTDDYRIIRHSLEKPKYKEKLRVRCYGEPSENSKAFVELKKKFNGVVYKRRFDANQKQALDYLCDGKECSVDSQISHEISYFKESHENLKPRVYLSYEREAYFCTTDENFRLTFDFDIKARETDVSFYETSNDQQVLSSDFVLLEVKTVMGMPKWFLDYLSENEVFKTSFSKYGTAYQMYFSENLGGVLNV